MKLQRRVKLIGVAVVCCISWYFIYINIIFKYKKRNHQSHTNLSFTLTTESATVGPTDHANQPPTPSLFLIDTPTCKIPDLQPYDASLHGLLKPGVTLQCTKYKPYTYDKGNYIFVDQDAIAKSIYRNTFSHCRLTLILRPVTNNSDHNALKYLPAGATFVKSIDVTPFKHDHFLVKCFDRKETFLFENYHTIIIEKEQVEQRCKEKMKEKKSKEPDIKETLSILVILVDSVSRVNSIRHMKQTRNYLMDVLNVTDIAGLNKVGERTYGNVIPLITGKSADEFGWKYAKPTVFDSYRFVWDDFADNGYRTYYAEDFPYGTFIDYDKPGFKKDPTDYYNRHVFLSMYERPTKIVYNEENCILHKTQTEWVIDNAHKFIVKFKSKPYFCIVMLTRITHDYLERTPTADKIYSKYLKKIYEEGLLNNTALFFMADHGMRYGAIQNSYNGKLEDSLPMLYIALPKWFKEKYPNRMKNLITNSHRLTTPFDIHETFQELLHFTGNDRLVGGKSASGKTRAYSLFMKVPLERNCTSADIPVQFCSCSNSLKVDLNSSAVTHAVEYALKQINIKMHGSCETLKLSKINHAFEVKPLSKLLSPSIKSHHISFSTTPGGVSFEGVVDYDTKKRIHKFGSIVKNSGDLSSICFKNITKF